MAATTLACDRCRRPFPPELLGGAEGRCDGCGREARLEVFPALLRGVAAGAAASAVLTDEAACFHHPAKQAVAACESCGRFLCALCDLEVHGVHYCSACLEQSRKKGRTVHRRDAIRYDRLALMLATVPCLFVLPTLLTAPTTIGVVLFGWRRQNSLVSRGRAGFLVSLVLALLQIGLWVTIVVLGVME
jgi:hypothetical protein